MTIFFNSWLSLMHEGTAGKLGSISLSDWTWAPWIVVPVLLTALLYARGLIVVTRRSNSVRTYYLPAAFFGMGCLTLLIALDSPIHELSEQLFWVHMTQHEILMLVSAPLLVISRPLAVMLVGLPGWFRSAATKSWRTRNVRRLWAVISAPFAAWLLHGLALWLWHFPPLFDATLRDGWVHAAQHICFLGTALLFWWALLDVEHARAYGTSLLYVFTTGVHTSILGALLTFSPKVWFAPYVKTAPAWGLTALEDQQIGGLIMWIPAGTVYLAISIYLIVKLMTHSDKRWAYSSTASLLRAPSGGNE